MMPNRNRGSYYQNWQDDTNYMELKRQADLCADANIDCDLCPCNQNCVAAWDRYNSFGTPYKKMSERAALIATNKLRQAGCQL
jgi:hypothetical protein